MRAIRTFFLVFGLVFSGMAWGQNCPWSSNAVTPGVYPSDTLIKIFGYSQAERVEIVLPGDTNFWGIPLLVDSVVLDGFDWMPPEMQFQCVYPLGGVSHWDTSGLHRFCIEYSLHPNYALTACHNQNYPGLDQLKALFSSHITIPLGGPVVLPDTVVLNYWFENWIDSFGNAVAEQAALGLRVVGNPAGESARVMMDLPEASAVEVGLMDATGRQLQLVRQDALQPGRQEILLNVSGLAGGIYLVRVRANELSSTVRFLKW